MTTRSLPGKSHDGNAFRAELLQQAIQYRRHGWSVIPVKGDKQAACRWLSFQSRKPSEADLRKLFRRPDVAGVAVVLGPASGNLGCRDFDTVEAYVAWAASYPELARTFPTVATARGYHVYFRAEVVRTRKIGDGELRGSGGYCVLPPSRHPSGAVYRWHVTLADGDVPAMDPADTGLARRGDSSEDAEGTEGTEKTEATEETRDHRCGRESGKRTRVSVFSVEQAVKLALPQQSHENHHHLFTLARALLSYCEHRREQDPSYDVSMDELRAAFDSWRAHAQPHLRVEQSRDEYWFEFLESWGHARYPLGEDSLREALETAKSMDPPAVAMMFETPEVRQLVGLCRELQRRVGDKPFYLSCRKVQELFGHSTHAQGARWLRRLERSGVIRTVEKGGPKTNRATRFRYLPPLDE